MKYLITGGCGFLGANIALEVSKNSHELVLLDNLYRNGSYANLEKLKNNCKFTFIHADTRNSNDLESAIKEHKPNVVFHLAGQVAMTTSVENPRQDFETNALGTFNLLESVRKFSPNTIIVYSSTNKVYGDLEQFQYIEQEKRYTCKEYENGFDENVGLNFQSPYGCSKGAADQYLLDYYKMFGIRTVVLRHSTMFGINQHATFDQGWIGWFCQKALEIKNNELKEEFTISGNGKQVRDVLFSSDAVNCYLSVVENIEKVQGKAFNIGGGIDNSLSLLELFDILEEKLNIKMTYKQIEARKSDQKVFVADITNIKSKTGWAPKTDKKSGVHKMLEWMEADSK